MLTRREKQFIFTQNVALLLQEMKRRGYNPILGYAFRCKDCPVGEENSLHKKCLAVDIELFASDGTTYLTDTLDHKDFGTFWESLHPLNHWGGRFSDGNHYSMKHGGMM